MAGVNVPSGRNFISTGGSLLIFLAISFAVVLINIFALIPFSRFFDNVLTSLSDEYFGLSQKDGLLRRILALGEEVMFEWNNKVYKVIQD